MSSRLALNRTLSGPPATGTLVSPASIGFPARGCLRRTPVPSGPPATGAIPDGRYGFHHGYWGPHIGYYGGVNYGGGYMGIGFAGGSWNGGVFAYNTAVVNVNRTVVTNVYVNRTIVEQTTIINTTNVSYNGGPHGVQHQAAPEEQIAAHEQHTPPTTFQIQHVTAAAAEPSNLAKNNGGHPTNLASPSPWPRKFMLRRRASNLRRPSR